MVVDHSVEQNYIGRGYCFDSLGAVVIVVEGDIFSEFQCNTKLTIIVNNLHLITIAALSIAMQTVLIPLSANQPSR